MVLERLVPDPKERYLFEVNFASDIDSKLEAADAIIDNMLKGFVKVPISNPPRIISEAAADIAAALFLFDRKDVERARELMKRAESMIEIYRSSYECFRTLEQSKP